MYVYILIYIYFVYSHERTATFNSSGIKLKQHPPLFQNCSSLQSDFNKGVQLRDPRDYRKFFFQNLRKVETYNTSQESYWWWNLVTLSNHLQVRWGADFFADLCVEFRQSIDPIDPIDLWGAALCHLDFTRICQIRTFRTRNSVGCGNRRFPLEARTLVPTRKKKIRRYLRFQRVSRKIETM